jgi:hypothetical protein
VSEKICSKRLRNLGGVLFNAFTCMEDIKMNGKSEGITVVRHRVMPSEAPKETVFESKINTANPMAVK